MGLLSGNRNWGQYDERFLQKKNPRVAVLAKHNISIGAADAMALVAEYGPDPSVDDDGSYENYFADVALDTEVSALDLNAPTARASSVVKGWKSTKRSRRVVMWRVGPESRR
ncbi:BQ5605_C026g10143 [Microbotryum silenes-dioicae]|uniref:BQ5605_C026g10143 protein n=1 Tax=Microbotryum silenes-dioicae TaxID=796604 RepID=A0A2X0PLY4_9BASI|nr:BQ5605_C026g10143 [Microbotryum silenes-dioicae]